MWKRLKRRRIILSNNGQRVRAECLAVISASPNICTKLPNGALGAEAAGGKTCATLDLPGVAGTKKARFPIANAAHCCSLTF